MTSKALRAAVLAAACALACARAASAAAARADFDGASGAAPGPALAASAASALPSLPAPAATPPASAPAPSVPAAAPAGPAQVILIRHGEKPASGDDLSPRGYQRAAALVGFFRTNPAVLEHGLPAAIYAEQPRPDGKQSRPLETVRPLADALGMTVNTDFQKTDAEGLARAVLSDPSYVGRAVLIGWEHHMLPAIAKALGWDAAPDWPDAAFDRVWIIDFDGGKPVRFRDLPQRLLPGDSDR
jgi:hypothetical protein